MAKIRQIGLCKTENATLRINKAPNGNISPDNKTPRTGLRETTLGVQRAQSNNSTRNMDVLVKISHSGKISKISKTGSRKTTSEALKVQSNKLTKDMDESAKTTPSGKKMASDKRSKTQKHSGILESAVGKPSSPTKKTTGSQESRLILRRDMPANGT